MEKMLIEHKSISEYILQTKEMLDEVGVKLVKEALKATDKIVRESKERKRYCHIERRDKNKSFLTKFGQVNYKRIYYEHKKHGTYNHLIG